MTVGHRATHRSGPEAGHDSAGIAWAGRSVTSTGFDDDRGASDPVVLALLGQYAAVLAVEPGPTAESDPTADRVATLERAVFEAVAAARWLVPISAVATGVEETGGANGHPVETSVEMAVALIEAPDGRRALPMFSSLESLAAWDERARPVPVSADRAAQSAVADGCQSILIDLADAHAVELRPSMVWALAMRREWRPAHQDPHVAQAVVAAVSPHPEIVDARLSAGRPIGTLLVTLGLRVGLDAARVTELATEVAEAMAGDGEVRARIDAVTFSIAPAAPAAGDRRQRFAARDEP